MEDAARRHDIVWHYIMDGLLTDSRREKDEARTFYEHFDLIPSPSDPYHLFRLLKGLRNLLKS